MPSWLARVFEFFGAVFAPRERAAQDKVFSDLWMALNAVQASDRKCREDYNALLSQQAALHRKQEEEQAERIEENYELRAKVKRLERRVKELEAVTGVSDSGTNLGRSGDDHPPLQLPEPKQLGDKP